MCHGQVTWLVFPIKRMVIPFWGFWVWYSYCRMAWNEHKQNFNLLPLVAAEENNVFHYTAIISSCGESFKWECALNFLREMADSQARWIKSHIPNIAQQKIVGEFQGATNMQWIHIQLQLNWSFCWFLFSELRPRSLRMTWPTVLQRKRARGCSQSNPVPVVAGQRRVSCCGTCARWGSKCLSALLQPN